jgi:multidrug resistance efflux pump
MNSEIDLKNFGSGNAIGSSGAAPGLVGPPRRLLTRYALPLVLLGAFIGVGVFAFRESLVQTVDVIVTMPVMASDDMTQSLIAPDPVETGPVRGETLFQAPGWIEPEPYATVISSLRMGTVETIHVIEGQAVTSGALIAMLVDDDARLAVASAESNLKLKEAQYQAALANWKNPTSLTEMVETARATGDKLQAESRRLRELLELARIEAEVGNTLTRSGYEASLETIRKETQLSASRSQLAETHAQIKLNSATLAAASERLALRIEDREAVETAKAELMSAQTQLDTARLQLKRSVISAPMDGIIMRLLASPGSMLSTDMENGMTVATMYQPERLQVRVDVPLSEAAKVKPGLDAEIKVEALPDVSFRGELVNIVPEFDLQKNILPVKVRIYDPVVELRPEMIARVEFFRDTNNQERSVESVDAASTDTKSRGRSETLLIPADLVQVEGGKSSVTVASADGTAVRKEITLAKKSASKGMVPVTEGLRISDKLITSPANVPAGTSVRVKGFVEYGSN